MSMNLLVFFLSDDDDDADDVDHVVCSSKLTICNFRSVKVLEVAQIIELPSVNMCNH